MNKFQAFILSLLISINSWAAMDFDGTTGYTSAGDSASLDVTTKLTIAFWMNRTSSTKVHWGKWALTGAENKGYLLQIYTDNLIYWAFSTDTSDTKYQVSSAAVDYTGWHHLAGTYNAGTVVIYVDGVAIGSTLASGPLPTTLANSNSPFGNRYAGTHYSTGQADCVLVYSRDLSAQEIYSLAQSRVCNPNTDNLVLWYRFDEGIDGATGTGTNVILDRSGNGNHATVTGGATWKAPGWVSYP